MKKIFLITLAILSLQLTSCSSDDDNIIEDPIIGVWKVNKVTIDGEIFDLGECELNSTETFFANGVYAQNNLLTNGSGACLKDDFSARWKKLSDGVYAVGQQIDLDAGEDFEQYNVQFNGNTIIISITNPIGNVLVTELEKK